MLVGFPLVAHLISNGFESIANRQVAAAVRAPILSDVRVAAPATVGVMAVMLAVATMLRRLNSALVIQSEELWTRDFFSSRVAKYVARHVASLLICLRGQVLLFSLIVLELSCLFDLHVILPCHQVGPQSDQLPIA